MKMHDVILDIHTMFYHYNYKFFQDLKPNFL